VFEASLLDEMTPSSADLEEALRLVPLVAILRRPQADLDLCARILSDAGVRLIEVTIDTPGAIEFLQRRTAESSSTFYGAGTVLTVELAEKAISAGAAFLVTPNCSAEVIAIARAHRRFIFTGAMTPTEIYSAFRAGANMIKVFPAASLGPNYFRELRGPLSDIPLMATGGISPQNAAEFFRAGVKAIGVGSSLSPRNDSPAEVARIQQIVQQLLDAARS
jgi:2-dehydro-3-deoxyphosphogluconate aldolase / (4S)-4-hydroxy-2-oxoglutarate aldolase